MLNVNVFSRLLSQRGKQTAVIDLFPSDREAVFLLRQSGSQLLCGKADLSPLVSGPSQRCEELLQIVSVL